MKNQKTKKILFYLLLFFLGATIASISIYILIKNKEQKLSQQHLQEIQRKKSILLKKKMKQAKIKTLKRKILQSKQIKADSFIVKNLDTNEVIFSKNSDRMFALASLTKIATATVFLNNYKNPINIKISPLHLLSYGNSGLLNNEIFNSKNLLKLMLIESSNDAATALSYVGTNDKQKHQDFLKKMNELAYNLDMKSTVFFSVSGLDITDNVNGSYSTANDLTKLLKNFYKNYPNIAKEVAVNKTKICSNLICHNVKNTNPLIEKNQNIIFSKTGWTEQAQGNLALIYKINNTPYAIIILRSSKNGRFTDAENLIQALQDFLFKKE